MTYRVTRVLCRRCKIIQRIRVRVDEDGEEFPPCPRCGFFLWGAEEGVGLTSRESSAVKWTPKIASEFQEFMEDFNKRQAEYIRRQFMLWRHERHTSAEEEEETLAASTSVMFREIWCIMESPE